jgi:T5SS/PEP-CTERM-associated repeat protein
LSPSAHAVVQTTGNVLLSPDSDVDVYTGLYADNPFTTTVNEGIPTNGNRIDPFRGNTGAPLFAFIPNQQIEFEGRPVLNGAGIGDDENVNFSVIVGRTSSGEMIINQSQLRDLDLVIGDQGMVGGTVKNGTGVVRIEGFGSLYNNNPFFLPYVGVDPDTLTPDMVSDTPRPDGVGFDMFIGRFGNGVLQLALGGHAEIQDAAIVGDQSGSVGTLTIDGIDSFLQSGGFETDDTAIDEPHYMIVGRLGSGTMTIANGGQSYNSGPVSSSGGGDEVFGAVIGSNLAALDTAAPGAGGQGTVYVDGVASKWTIGGNLQVGGFHDKRDGIGPAAVEDLDGNEVQYFAGTGRGTLHVNNGALVSIVTPPLEANATNAPDRLDLLVGRFGRVELDGGRIELLGAFNASNPQNPTQQLTNGRLINDGVVIGDGSISVLQFRNRVFGEVRVGAGQSLLVDSTGSFAPVLNEPVLGGPEYPLSNYGLIEVLGTETELAEIEFRRAPGTTTAPIELIRPFLNLPLLSPPSPGNGRTGGEIIGQNSIMRFDSGIINSHKLTFTGGTNEVVGNFDNQGTVFIGGDNTTVTFVDQFFNNGQLHLDPNISLVIFVDDVTFGGSGSLDTTFGGRPTGQEISHLSSAEDIVLGGTLNASLFTSPGVPSFSPQPGDQFEIISSAADLFGDFATVNLPGCINVDTCFVGFADFALDAYFIRTFSIMAAVGADFDGNGIVDALDLNIWRQNVGAMGAPGTVPGDANGDGVVNGQDFIRWQMQVGGPGVPGAGSGGVAGIGGTVPEPASIALVVSGGLLALALGRRRSI